MKPLMLLLSMGLALASCTSNEKKAAPLNNITGNRTPEQELAGFKVPDDFIVELVASEKDGVIKPIDITFDDAGRLWTQTATMYPLDPVADIQWNDLLELMNHPEKQANHPNFKRVLDLYKGHTKGTDKILVLSDFYNYDKPAVNTTVWADGLTIPMSILPYKNGAYVAQGSEMFFLDDSDKDGKADKRDSLFTGFGFTDTHTMAHTLVRAPGGWIYFSHGALNKGDVRSYVSDAKLKLDYSKIARFANDGKKIELVTAGLNNIWGFQLRDKGQWYITEANDFGFSIVPMDPGSALRGIGNERFKTYQPWVPELHKFRVGGTGISGLAFDDDISGSFPDEWKDVAFLANPITSTINAVKVKRNADGSVSAEHLKDFLISDDKYFRPVNIEFGPDGSLYIADWYNKIISHNEIPTTHPDRDKSQGRIWRIRHKSQKAKSITDYYKLATAELPENLKSPSLWARRAALNQIIDRPLEETKSLVPALNNIVSDATQNESVRIHALWALEGLKHYDAALVKTLLSNNNADELKREAIRSLAAYDLSAADLANTVSHLIDDPNAMVRSQVLRTIGETGKIDSTSIAVLLKACKPEIAGNEMGSSYERKFERFLALQTLEQYPQLLSAYLNSHSDVPAANILWALMALPKGEKEKWFLKAWAQAQPGDLKETEFVMTVNILDHPQVYAAVKPVLQNAANAKQYLLLALDNQDIISTKKLPELLQPSAVALLKSQEAADKNLALDAIARLKMHVSKDEVVPLLNEQSTDETVQLALRVLENNIKENKAVFSQVAQNEKLNIDARFIALRHLTTSDAAASLPVAKNIAASANAEQKKNMASVLSGSAAGAALLTAMYTQKLIDIEAFSMSSAERVRNAHQKDQQAIAIFEATKKRIEDENNAFNDRLKKYMAIAEKKDGDAEKGKLIFQATCLMCHKVGDKGQDIAPALDGSANRENEALLTALLNPDAAVEGGYEVFRIIKKDNSVLEGYLYKKADNGITVAVMGGNKIFVPNADIKNTQVLGGRSFMPKGLMDQYADADVANLLAYIKTLK